MLGIGMISMIKRILLCLFFAFSCSTLKLEDYNAIINQFVSSSEDIIITDEIISSRKYSFMKVKIGNNAPVLMTLAMINDDIYTWISRDFVKIRTKHGKIINTVGLSHDVGFLNTSDFNIFEKDQESLLLEVQNPSAILSQKIDFTRLGEQKIFLHREYEALYFIESFKTDAYKWSGKNYYAYDSVNGLPIWSHQHIHPYLPSIEISFYYK